MAHLFLFNVRKPPGCNIPLNLAVQRQITTRLSALCWRTARARVRAVREHHQHNWGTFCPSLGPLMPPSRSLEGITTCICTCLCVSVCKCIYAVCIGTTSPTAVDQKRFQSTHQANSSTSSFMKSEGNPKTLMLYIVPDHSVAYIYSMRRFGRPQFS